MEILKIPRRAEKSPSLLLTVDEVAESTRMGTRTIWRHVSQGTFPAPIYIGRSARWHRKKVEDFFDGLSGLAE